MGAVSASESINVQHTEDSNLMEGNDDSLSTINKLEVSSEDSISQTNIVYSHEDDLGNYPVEDNNLSTCEDNREIQSASNDFEADEGNNTLSLSGSSTDSVVAASSSNDSVSAASSTDGVVSASAKKVSTKLTVDNTHYGKSATYFILTLKDNAGKALKNQKVTLKVKNKVYSGVTNKNGQASIKTDALAVGTYTVSLSYAGNTNYSSSSISKKLKYYHPLLEVICQNIMGLQPRTKQHSGKIIMHWQMPRYHLHSTVKNIPGLPIKMVLLKSVLD